MTRTQQLPKDLQRYFKELQRDPVRFARDVLGIEPWDKQQEILYSVRDNRKTTVRSCNAAGKTTTAAMTMLWYLSVHPNSVVITTAPTWRQVQHILWAEAAKLYTYAKVPIGGNFLTTSWTMGPGWYALGLSTKEPDRFQGHHADHALGIVDEASGVDPAIFEALLACLTSENSRLLYIGNPMESAGTFYDSFQDPTFNKIHISAYDTPNIKAGRTIYPALVSQAWIDDLIARLGPDYEQVPEYQIRVLGEFPTTSLNTVIPIAWIEKCINIELEESNTCTMGVDPARFGDDETVVAVAKGQTILPLYITRHQDTVSVARFVKDKIDTYNPVTVAVDATGGLGAGVADMLRSWGYDQVIDLVVNRKAARSDKFVNQRAELWWNLREQIRTQTISLPDDEVLKTQLSSPKYEFDNKGRYKVEPKKDMKARGLMSPDRAEAVMLAVSMKGPLPSVIVPEFPVPVQKYEKDTLGWIIENYVKRREEETPWIW